MYPHRINLRGPWQCETLDTASPKRVQRVTMPCRWADTPLKDCTGRIRCQRRFHWQKPLDANERLFLVVGAADYQAAVTLNGHLLGKHEGAFDPFEFEITRLIQASNDLCIELDSQGGLWGTVFLEVRRDSFLQQVDIAVTWIGDTPGLEISGFVVSPEDRQLDVDLLLNDALLLSQPVKAAPAGEPFRLKVDVPGIERWQPSGFGVPKLHELRVELLDVHSRLFVQEYRIGFREVRLPRKPERPKGDIKAMVKELTRELASAGFLQSGQAPELEQTWINGHCCLLQEPWVLDEPLLESPTLDKADAEGRLLRVALPERCGSGTETIRRHLRRHPSVAEILHS